MDGLIALWLFGCVARGEATPISDVDLAYLPDPSLQGTAAEHFATELYCAIADALHTDEFAFVNVREAPVYFAWRILTEGKVLVCRDEREIAQLAETVYRLAPDIRWLRRS